MASGAYAMADKSVAVLYWFVRPKETWVRKSGGQRDNLDGVSYQFVVPGMAKCYLTG